MKKFFKNKKVIAVIIVVLLIGIFAYSRSNGAVKADVYEVKRSDIKQTISASGETASKEGYYVLSGVNSSVVALKHKSGDIVKEGDIIIELDRSTINSAVQSNLATIMKSNSDIDSLKNQIASLEAQAASNKLNRDILWREYMADDGDDNKQAYKAAEAAYLNSLSDIETLKNQIDTAESARNSGYASYNASSKDLASTIIKAPKSGVLVLSDLKIGELVTQGQELLNIATEEGIEFVAEVDEADIELIQPDLKAEIVLDSLESQILEGTVYKKALKTSVSDSDSTIIKTYLDLNNIGDKQILIGLSGSADIVISSKQNVISLPFDAVLFDDADKPYVFVLDNGVAKKRNITIGIEGEETYEVTEGLNEGDKVILGEAISTIKDGQKVTVNSN